MPRQHMSCVAGGDSHATAEFTRLFKHFCLSAAPDAAVLVSKQLFHFPNLKSNTNLESAYPCIASAATSLKEVVRGFPLAVSKAVAASNWKRAHGFAIQGVYDETMHPKMIALPVADIQCNLERLYTDASPVFNFPTQQFSVMFSTSVGSSSPVHTAFWQWVAAYYMLSCARWAIDHRLTNGMTTFLDTCMQTGPAHGIREVARIQVPEARVVIAVVCTPVLSFPLPRHNAMEIGIRVSPVFQVPISIKPQPAKKVAVARKAAKPPPAAAPAPDPAPATEAPDIGSSFERIMRDAERAAQASPEHDLDDFFEGGVTGERSGVFALQLVCANE